MDPQLDPSQPILEDLESAGLKDAAATTEGSAEGGPPETPPEVPLGALGQHVIPAVETQVVVRQRLGEQRMEGLQLAGRIDREQVSAQFFFANK